MCMKRISLSLILFLAAVLVALAAPAELVVFDDAEEIVSPAPVVTEAPSAPAILQATPAVTLAPAVTPAPTVPATPRPESAPTPTPAPNPILYTEGDVSEEIREIKKRLQALGYFSSENRMGAEFTATTAERVAQFQRQNGLRETGSIDEMTRAAVWSDAAVPANATARPALSALYGENMPVNEQKVEEAVREALAAFFPLIGD